MEKKEQIDLSLKTLASAVFLGISGDVLLRDMAWGAGFSIYCFLVAAVAAYLYRGRKLPFDRGVVWLAPPLLLFASMFAWRDSAALKVLDGVALFALAGMMALRARVGGIGIGTLLDYPFRLFGRWFVFVADFCQLARLEGNWPALANRQWMSRMAAVGRGLLIAVPMLLLFGGLFMSADAAFEQLVNRSFSIDVEALWSNIFVALACTWLVGGFLRRLFLAPMELKPPVAVKPAPLGITEIGVVLGLLNLLFFTFVVIQARYLFGGASFVHSVASMNVKDYARRGFFELVWVSALALPVLAGSYSLLRKSTAEHLRVYRALAGSLVALLLVIMASAVQRLDLYIVSWGVTTLRIYAAAVIGWLAVVFVWFCMTTLRDKPEKFAFGTIVSALAVIGGLNALNPDALVARANSHRSGLDTDYLSNLSSDAIPELVKALPKMPLEDQLTLRKNFAERRKDLDQMDWRSWDLGAAQAAAALK